MRYYQKMLRLACELTRDGFIVLMPHDSSYQDGTTSDKTKEMLDDMHRTKIGMSERIYVVGSHIGESTSGEIKYAIQHDIQIIYVGKGE
jgi:hypothetical protein